MAVLTLVVVAVEVLTTTETLRVATVVRELLSSDTKSELLISNKSTHRAMQQG
jgi:hypothetical protein